MQTKACQFPAPRMFQNDCHISARARALLTNVAQHKPLDVAPQRARIQKYLAIKYLAMLSKTTRKGNKQQQIFGLSSPQLSTSKGGVATRKSRMIYKSESVTNAASEPPRAGPRSSDQPPCASATVTLTLASAVSPWCRHPGWERADAITYTCRGVALTFQGMSGTQSGQQKRQGTCSRTIWGLVT